MNDGGATLLVVNPVAGRGRAGRTAEMLLERLRRWGMDADIETTSAAGDAERLTQERISSHPGKYRRIVACGGDGTVQEVAHALGQVRQQSGSQCATLAIAPSGRCNDFARTLGISTNPYQIAEVLINGRERQIDLGRVNGRFFCTVLTAGIDAEISRFVDEAHLPLTGTPAYLLATFIVLARYRPRCLRLTGDFGETRRRVFIASAANTSSYGGAVPIAPNADPADGLLDVCTIDGLSIIRAVGMIPRILAGRHVGHPNVTMYRTRRVALDSDVPLELWADGQRMAETPAVVEAVQGAVRVLAAR